MKRPPFETFKGAICKGAFALGSACGSCEKCLWERTQIIQESPSMANPEPCKSCGADLSKVEISWRGREHSKDDCIRNLLAARAADAEALAKAAFARKHTQEWYASRYGKLQDWARKRLPDPWRNEFFNCVANGTWGHEDTGKPYRCKAGFDITPTNYFRVDTAEGQLILDQTQRAEEAEATIAARDQRIDRLEALLNTPEVEDFDKAIPLEAAHQVQRWGNDHDSGKGPQDWFWLVGYLAGKCLRSHIDGKTEKAKHHAITVAAACRNWHAQIRSGDSLMRPGIEPPVDAALAPPSQGTAGTEGK